MTRTPTQCSSCRAKIFWARTPKGKLMPCDYEPAADGNLVLDEKGIVHAIPPGDLFTDERFKSHFASCPNAQRHRKH